MKILLINAFHYPKGGSETVYFNTAKLLKKKGHEAIFFSLNWKENIYSSQSSFFASSKENNTGIKQKTKNLLNYFYHREAKKKLDLLLKKEKPDIAHVHLFWGQISPSIFSVLKKHHVPLVHTVHDYRMICPAYTFRNGNGKVCEACYPNKYYQCFLKKCAKKNTLESLIMSLEMYLRNIFFHPIKNISGLVYVSHFSQKKHLAFNNKFSQLSSLILYNFYNKTQVKDVNKKNYFLFFGRLSEEKGINTLIDAAKMQADCKFKIVGTGPLEEKIKQQIVKDKLTNISLLGFQTGDELIKTIAQARFVIVPSTWYENNPMSIIESYAQGTPVIASNIGGIPEIVKDNRTGFLIEPNSSTSLSEAIVKAKNIKKQAYSLMQEEISSFFQEHFQEENHYNSLSNFYKEIIRKKI